MLARKKHLYEQKRLWSILALVLLLPAGSAFGSTTGKTNEDGSACPLPDFSFEWRGNSELVLAIEAPEPYDFLVRLRPHRSSGEKAPRWIPVPPVENEKPEPRGEKTIESESDTDGGAAKHWYHASSAGKDATTGAFRSEVDINPDALALGKTDGHVIVEWVIATRELESGVGDQQSPMVKSETDSLEKETRDKPKSEDICSTLLSGRTEPIVALRRHVVAFDAGSTFSLDSDGDYEQGAEVAISAISRWRRDLTGYSDFRFSRMGALDEQEEMMPANGASGGMGGSSDQGSGDGNGSGQSSPGSGEPADNAGDDFINPFEQAGNIIQFNSWVGFHPWTDTRDRLVHPVSFIVGAGLSTRPGESDDVDVGLRTFTGIRLQIAHYHVEAKSDIAAASGFLQFGYAHDDFWKFTDRRDMDGNPETTDDVMEVVIDEPERWFVESQFTIPQFSLGKDSGQMKIRFYADVPVSGDGPSDIRVSVLFGYDLSKLLTGIQ